MKLIRTILLMTSTILLGACASMLNGQYQPLTIIPEGGNFESDTCTLSNSQGEWSRTGTSETLVRRAYGPLKVDCYGDQHVGTVTVESQTQWRYFWANFIIWDLCTISCVVDIGTGAFFDYPTVIRVPMRPLAGAATQQPLARAGSNPPVQSGFGNDAPVEQPATTARLSDISAGRDDSIDSMGRETFSIAAAQRKAEHIMQTGQCHNLTLEHETDAGALYRMSCSTGKTVVLCSAAGCRISD